MVQSEFNKVELIDTTKTRASLKIQDGCDNRCTYCIIWKARGKSRSADSKFIIEQINNFSKNGFKRSYVDRNTYRSVGQKTLA